MTDSKSASFGINITPRLLRALLRPIVRMCLKSSLTLQVAIEELKRVFVEEAFREISDAGDKPSDSRVSVRTGLHRGEVKRIRTTEPGETSDTGNVLAKVIGQWMNDPRFCAKGGKPKVLSYEGENDEFTQLVRTVNSCYGTGTVLLELLRLGTVEKSAKGLVLRRKMLALAENEELGLAMMAKDFATLTDTVQSNLSRRFDVSSLHVRTEYDNVLASEIPRIRKWILDEGKKFHQRVREYVSKWDKDINLRLESDEQGGGKVVVTAFGLAIEDPDRISSN